MRALVRLSRAVFLGLLMSVFVNLSAFAEEKTPVIFEYRGEPREIVRGVTYQKVRQVTQAGLRDIFITTVDITNPNIALGPAESVGDYGRKKPLTQLLSENGAIAGVNADFFGMAGNYSLSFGPVVRDGRLISVSKGTNDGDGHDMAAFFISDDDSPFISFVHAEIEFLNDNKRNLNVLSINKVTDMKYPIILNRRAMSDTAALDSRFDDLYKLVVEGNVITYISQAGETVEVPENGYLVVMDKANADAALKYFAAGQGAAISFKTVGIDFERIKTAVGGGARILANGDFAPMGVSISGRQPRTALGISQDKKKIILVAVDGRTHSIGANPEELGDIMKRFGAYNAMNLDGGGSTTMALKFQGDTGYSVVNRPSDGAQRRVINGLGVFNTAPLGNPVEIEISAGRGGVLYRNQPVKLDVYGLDEYGRRVELALDDLSLADDDEHGFFKNGVFYPSTFGDITIEARAGGLSGSRKFVCRELQELHANVSEIRLMEGESLALSFSGVDQLGAENPIDSGVAFAIAPPNLGAVENGVFTAKEPGNGYMECSMAGVSAYIPIFSGGLAVPLPAESARVSFDGYPKDVVTGWLSELHPKEGYGTARDLNYNLKNKDVTQAAYLVFDEPLGIAGEPSAIRADVFGNNSGMWLRAKFQDAKGEIQIIDFTGEINWEGKRTVNALIPKDTAYPVALTRIYVVTSGSDGNVSGQVSIGAVSAVYPILTDVPVPKSSEYKDNRRVDLSAAPAEESWDIAAIGSAYAKTQDGKPPAATDGAISEKMKGAEIALYAADTTISGAVGASVHRHNTDYSFKIYKNAAVMNLCAEKGSFTKTAPWQWASIDADIKNSPVKNIIITTDKNPLNMSPRQEFDLFNDELVKLREAGKNIFVLSSEGTGTAVTVRDGVRYVNLGSLFAPEGDGGVYNENFRVLRIRVAGDDMYYDLKPVN
ncbi:MAG: phosphodiester glycosidase family protein [Clostridiales bacterium]|jgi:hypothetical protein|nr:phosphodiester glycosidase family protein [Clostridiales bacterium]